MKDVNRLKVLDQNLQYQLSAFNTNESIVRVKIENIIIIEKNQLSADISKAKEQLDVANLQKDRLTKIISICQKNKKHNQLWIQVFFSLCFNNRN